jgi:regulator of replication initiation timing
LGDIDELKELLQATFFRLKEDVDSSKRHIDALVEENKLLREKLSELSSKVETKKEDNLKKEVVAKFRRHKKDMIKHKIVETVRLKRMSLPELKEIIVDQMGYCSKATFYRYYDDLRKEGTIAEKNKIIISNVLSIV